MGTQSNDRGGDNRQSQDQKQGGQGDPQRKPGGDVRQGQGPQQGQGGKGPQESGRDDPDTTRERLASDDEAGGEPDADGELNQPGQMGNKDRESSGSTRTRNP